eukprot:GHVN01059172.1.p1 GENE.GHVN01059172.1~~GHVN01059172.1.p1  ORF type:complete len:244 (+),score=35.53 GHVN01059172.1:89-820(+)
MATPVPENSQPPTPFFVGVVCSWVSMLGQLFGSQRSAELSNRWLVSLSAKIDHGGRLINLLNHGNDVIQAGVLKAHEVIERCVEWQSESDEDPEKILAVACEVWVECHSHPRKACVHSYQEQLKRRLSALCVMRRVNENDPCFGEVKLKARMRKGFILIFVNEMRDWVAGIMRTKRFDFWLSPFGLLGIGPPRSPKYTMEEQGGDRPGGGGGGASDEKKTSCVKHWAETLTSAFIKWLAAHLQ